MTVSAAQLIVQEYGSVHAAMLAFLQKLSDAELRWSIQSGGLSIAWHGWHVARWADHLQAAVPGMTPALGERLGAREQTWHRDGLVARWGFPAGELGYDDTGMHMADAVAWRLPFPPRETLLDYVERAFTTAEQAVSAIDDAQFSAIEGAQDMTEGIFGEGTVGSAVLEHVTHAYRHLGMMECLLGLQGGRGSATQ